MDKVKIFAIDDEPGVLHAIKAILYDYDVYTETDPQRAIEWFCKEKFDIVIVDFQIPVINGLEILEEINKVYKNSKPYITILATSFGTTHLFHEEFKDRLFTFFLEKPINAEKLRSILYKSTALLTLRNNILLCQ